MTNPEAKRIGVLWRAERGSTLEDSRYKAVGDALAAQGLRVEAVPFTDDGANEVRSQLRDLDGVLVWVDPIAGGKTRAQLDVILRDAAAEGTWVSTHPDVILKMGTKDVLVATRDLAWGSDCHLYRTQEEMETGLAARLDLGPRVLKQHRGNGGNGVWKVEWAGRGTGRPDTLVNVLHAQRESSLETMTLAAFLDRCRAYFTDSGCMVEQPYQERLADGMIRCYMVQDRVAGFGHQFVTALLPPPEGTTTSPLPPPRLYYGPDKPEFQAIKQKLEGGWIEAMQHVLGISTDELPALWDADFLYGPTDASGSDTYVLCEINVSCVSPFPDEALEPLALLASHRLQQ